MDCTIARSWLFRLLDEELSPAERDRLQVSSRLLSVLHQGMEDTVRSPGASEDRSRHSNRPPSFMHACGHAWREKSQSITIWQIILGLSRQIVPALATVTLVIISLFAYLEFRGPKADFYQAYDSIFLSGDRPSRMVIAEEITEESVLHALAEKSVIPGPGAPQK